LQNPIVGITRLIAVLDNQDLASAVIDLRRVTAGAS
jgi:hypothetical protein